MTAPVFVDTGVQPYWRDARDPAKQARTAERLAHLWRERAGRTSVQVLAEYHANLTRTLDPGLAVLARSDTGGADRGGEVRGPGTQAAWKFASRTGIRRCPNGSPSRS